MKKVRVRFAPSPTGALHIGGVRTALYNYLLARKHGGTMILRIEDTDQTRFVPGAEEYIIKSLEWVGIKIDEGVGVGGPHAPYRQSERKKIYKQYADQLVSDGNAYYAFDTEDELDQHRKASPSFTYGPATRTKLNNSLVLTPEEVSAKLSSGANYVIRFKIPSQTKVTLHDLIRGEVTVDSDQLDDKVLMKSDGMPTYHLANVVDDYLMEISHVIRGEEWLPSAPLHVLLYRALGWEKSMPSFSHLPLLLKPDGNGKLSKRDADKMGFPIFPLNWTEPKTDELSIGFREYGYLPEAMINFLAFLGWNPGTEQEIFSLPELIESFSIERIGKAGAKFDIQKAQWFNQQYLRTKSDAELANFLLPQLLANGIQGSEEKIRKVCSLMRDRITFPADIWRNGTYFFKAPNEYDSQVISKKWSADTVRVLHAFCERLESMDEFTADVIKGVLENVSTSLSVGLGKIMPGFRVSITGQAGGPDLMMIMEVIGKQEVIKRIQHAIASNKIIQG